MKDDHAGKPMPFLPSHKLTRHRWQIAHIAILIEAYSIVFTMDYLNHETIPLIGFAKDIK